MENTEFDRDKIVNYWLDSSDDDFDTMMAMYESKRYSWSLFIGHLMIEKLLKALFVKVNNEFPPCIHNFIKISRKVQSGFKRGEYFVFCNSYRF